MPDTRRHTLSTGQSKTTKSEEEMDAAVLAAKESALADSLELLETRREAKLIKLLKQGKKTVEPFNETNKSSFKCHFSLWVALVSKLHHYYHNKSA